MRMAFLALFLLFWQFILLFQPTPVHAATIAKQTQGWSDTLNSWHIIQDLGTGLSGELTTFTFRVKTDSQINYTAFNTFLEDLTAGAIPIYACTPILGSDLYAGLQISTQSVPDGYEDLTIDFSCRHYQLDPTHHYDVLISNGNSYATLHVAGHLNTNGGDYFPEGDATHGVQDGQDIFYKLACFNYQPDRKCIPWENGGDIYFILNNDAPPPKIPVIFIPGIGGSELKTNSAINWSNDNGHGGTFNHTYPSNETVWVNQNEAIKPGEDDYFDVLKLESDGQTSKADIGLTGHLVPYGYGDVDNFFQSLGYQKGVNYFVFPYDFRKDVRSTKDDLDKLVEEAKKQSGQPQVNLVAHSMGGLVARNYIADPNSSPKINKLIELGVPHLGSVDAVKNLLEGSWMGRDFYLFKLGVKPSEVKDLVQNYPSAFELLPDSTYYSFYNNSSSNIPYPLLDDSDIDNNGVTGSLDYNQTKSLLNNLKLNINILNVAEDFHNNIDPTVNHPNSLKIYEIVGDNQPTLGQIKETNGISWPIKLFPKTDEIFVNGDDTVPIYSASLKSDSLDLSGSTNIYYVDQKHEDLPSQNGQAMQIVKKLLEEDDTAVEAQKISLSGTQISVDQNANVDLYDQNGNHTGLNSNGDIEENIPGTFYDSVNNTKHIFIKKGSDKVKVKITSGQSTNLDIKLRDYSSDTIDQTTLYHNVPVTDSTTIELPIDSSIINSPNLTDGDQTVPPTSTTTDTEPKNTVISRLSTNIDGTKNSDNTFTGTVIVTLTPTHPSDIATIEYSIDNGQTVKTYTHPLTFTDPGTYIIQVIETDKFGNQNSPQTITFTIISPITQVLNTSSNLGIGGGSTTSTSSNTTTSILNPLAPYFAKDTQQKYQVTSDYPSHQINNKLAEIKPELVLPQKTNSVKTVLTLLSILLGALSLALFCYLYPPPFSQKILRKN